MQYFEKQIRKGYLGDGYNKTFDNPTILLENDEMEKLKEFKKYCFEKQRCLNCNKKYTNARKEKGENNFNLILECANCLSNDILSDPVSQEYTKWLEETMYKTGADSFEEGFPIIPNYDINWAKGKPTVKRKENIKLRKEGNKK